MKKKHALFLFPYPSDTAASQRFRFEQYLACLPDHDWEYDKQSFLSQQTWGILYQKGKHLSKMLGILAGFWRRFWLLFRLYRYDVVFIHREASPLGPPIFEWIITKVWRKRVVFDFDDAIWLPNTSEQNAWVAWLKFHSKTNLICRWAWKVSAGNDYLCNYARTFNPKVVLNPTTIDTQNMHNRLRPHNNPEEKLVIGWTGTHSTLKYLDELVPILQNLEKRYDFEFLVIADKAPDFDLKSLRFVAWDKATEITDLLRMHVGVMPLVADKWAEGKCGFKALQYMALGIPALVSPVGVNTKIVDNEVNGYICDSPAAWEQALEKLLQNPTLRADMGKQARHKIETAYSVRANTRNFLDLLEK
ncbi:MAG: glycosyltransferase [Bacteroidetes bacterium]|nr:MAG: glycosyltransferase [Bacteroidota bacterium]